jgi:hypothetical protein
MIYLPEDEPSHVIGSIAGRRERMPHKCLRCQPVRAKQYDCGDMYSSYQWSQHFFERTCRDEDTLVAFVIYVLSGCCMTAIRDSSHSPQQLQQLQ